MSLVSRAWMVEPVELHREVDGLVRDGCMRERAIEIRAASDPIARTYLELLRCASVDEWTDATASTHLVDWYLTVVGAHVTPTRAFRSPDALRRRLPELGWTATEARRLAHGRELQLLVQTYADTATATSLAPQFAMALRGWLSATDVTSMLERMRNMDRTVFRDHQDLVGLVEHAYEVLEAAATKPDCVLLMLSD
jgi:hypothetical protein